MLEQVPCARAIKPKCSHCTLSHFLNHWEGAKDITGLLAIHFTMLKKTLCATVNLLPEKFRVFSVFDLMYPSADSTPLQKGGLQLHIRVFKIVEVNQSEVVFSGRCWTL